LKTNRTTDIAILFIVLATIAFVAIGLAMGGDEAKVYAVALSPSLVGVVLIGSGFYVRKRVRLIADTPRSKSSSAAQGFTELEGFCWPSAGVVSGVNGAEVLYYTFTLEKQVTQGHGKNKKRVWISVFYNSFVHPFYLVDATGLVKIDPAQAELQISGQHTREWTWLKPAEKNRILSQVINSQVIGFPPSEFLWGLFSQRFRVRESEILVGSQVHATGVFSTRDQSAEPVTSIGLTYFYQTLFDESSRTQKNIKHLLDRDKSGQVSADEARFGYTFAALRARKKAKLEPIQEKGFSVHGELHNSESHKLYVADTSEEHLTQRLNRRAGGLVAAGLVFMVLGTVLFAKVRSFENPKLGRTVAAQVTDAASRPPEPDVGRLHSECVAGVGASCNTLLLNRERIGLSKQHVDFYCSKSPGSSGCAR
jgi:hypothetical protein